MKDIESQTVAVKHSRLRVSKRVATLLMLCAACALMVLFNVHSSTQTVASRDLLKAGKATGGGADPEKEFFAGYVDRMTQEFDTFHFLPHTKEMEWEAAWYKSNGQTELEALYPQLRADKNYILVSMGTSSTQVIICKAGEVKSVAIDNGESIGTKAMPDREKMPDAKIKKLLNDVNALRTTHFAGSAVPIIMCNSIGYGANEYVAKEDTTLVPLGNLGQLNEPAAKDNAIVKAVARLSSMATDRDVKLVNAYVKPRKTPRIDNSWAKYAALRSSDIGGTVRAVVDCGGGAGKTTYVGKHGDTKPSEELSDNKKGKETVNGMFAASDKKGTVAGTKLAEAIIGQMPDALGKFGKTVRARVSAKAGTLGAIGAGGGDAAATVVPIHFYQTGDMRREACLAGVACGAF